jgi:hypothetical protein
LDQEGKRKAVDGGASLSHHTGVEIGSSVRIKGQVASRTNVVCNSCESRGSIVDHTVMRLRALGKIQPPPKIPIVPKYYAILKRFRQGIFFLLGGL